MNGLIFDSHAHYDDKAFDPDRGELLAALPQNGVGGVVNCGASLESSRTVVALAEAYPYVYAAVGVYPEEAGGWFLRIIWSSWKSLRRSQRWYCRRNWTGLLLEGKRLSRRSEAFF